jgi:hypothetical protein
MKNPEGMNDRQQIMFHARGIAALLAVKPEVLGARV